MSLTTNKCKKEDIIKNVLQHRIKLIASESLPFDKLRTGLRKSSRLPVSRQGLSWSVIIY